MTTILAKKTWTTVKLNEICRPKQWPTISSKQLKDTGHPVFGANGVIGYYDQYTHEKPTVLITCRGATCGTINLSLPKSYVTGNAMALDNLDETRVSKRYLLYFLGFRGLSDVISGSAQPQITRQNLSRVEFELPPLEEQRRIAEILDLADGLRAKRREALAEVEELTQAVFLEMFGTNRQHTVAPLGEKLQFLTSGSRGWAKYYSDQGAPFVRIQNVRHGYMDTDDMAYVKPPKSAEAERTRVRRDDVLLSITADLGRSAKVVPEVIGGHINQHLAILRLSKELRPDYLVGYLSSQPAINQFLQLNRGGVKAGLNFDNIRSLKVPVPPLNQQILFAERVESIEKLKASHQRSLEEMDALFASLQSRAFKGEL